MTVLWFSITYRNRIHCWRNRRQRQMVLNPLFGEALNMWGLGEGEPSSMPILARSSWEMS